MLYLGMSETGCHMKVAGFPSRSTCGRNICPGVASSRVSASVKSGSASLRDEDEDEDDRGDAGERRPAVTATPIELLRCRRRARDMVCAAARLAWASGSRPSRSGIAAERRSVTDRVDRRSSLDREVADLGDDAPALRARGRSR